VSLYKIMNKKILVITLSSILFCPVINAAKYDVLMERNKVDGKLFHDFNGSFDDAMLYRGGEDKYKIIINYLHNKQYAEADKKLTELLYKHPNDPKLYGLKGLLEIKKNKIKGARESFLKVIDLDQKNISAYRALANIEITNGKLNLAKGYFNKILAINDKYILAYYSLAAIAEKQNETQQVERYLSKGYQKSLGNVGFEIKMAGMLAKWYEKQNQPMKALVLAENVIKKYPMHKHAILLLVNAQMLNGKSDVSEGILQKIIALDKKEVRFRLLLANIISKDLSREKEVIMLLDEVSDIIPGSETPEVLKASFYLKGKKYKKSLQVIGDIKKKYPHSSAAYQIEGDIFYGEKKWEKALVAYKKAYQFQSSDKLLQVVVSLMLQVSTIDDAVKFLNNELKNNNNNTSVNLHLARVFLQQKKIEQAKQYYEKVLAIQSGNVEALNDLALIYAEEGNVKAIVLAKKAYSLAIMSSVVADTYGYVLTKHGEYNEAIGVLRKAVELDGESVVIQLHLAEAYVLNNENQQAVKLLRRILESEGSGSDKVKITKMLKKLTI